MAYRHSISKRANLIARQFHPSFTHILHSDNTKDEDQSQSQSQQITTNFIHQGLSGTNTNTSSRLDTYFLDRRCTNFSLLSPNGLSLCRYMSTTIGDGSDKIEYMSDVAEVLVEKTVEAVTTQAPVVSEVAIAAADSYLPVAILQYVIDGVHNLTGLNWWASIALTTLLIRGATLPLLISQLKATSKLTLMRPRLEEIKQEMQDKAMDSGAVAEGQQKMNALFKEYGVHPLTPLKGLFIQGPVFISFFFAISNMVEKVPSFKNGGAFWFTDLTTPDPLFIFPVLTGLTFLITVEFNMQEGLEGNPVAGTMKKFSRILAVGTVPFTMNFPKAIFFYWITSNFFSFMYGMVLKKPGVKEFLGVPKIPVEPRSPNQPAYSFIEEIKKAAKAASALSASHKRPSSLPDEPKELPDKRISSSSVISQRLKSLEKQVKGRKKNKKR